MSNINKYFGIIANITKNLQGVPNAIRVVKGVDIFKENMYLAQYGFDKTYRFFKLKKHKFVRNVKKIKKKS